MSSIVVLDLVLLVVVVVVVIGQVGVRRTARACRVVARATGLPVLGAAGRASTTGSGSRARWPPGWWPATSAARSTGSGWPSSPPPRPPAGRCRSRAAGPDDAGREAGPVVSAVLQWSLRRAEREPDPAEVALHTELLAGLRGVVVEVGCGRGRLFARYPPTVDPAARGRARPRDASRGTARRGRVARTRRGRGRRGRGVAAGRRQPSTPWSSPRCCAACPTRPPPSPRPGRVLRPGGELRVFEHVAAAVRGRPAAGQRVTDRVIWSRLLGGCETSRDTTRAVEAAGFTWRGLCAGAGRRPRSSSPRPARTSWARRPLPRQPVIKESAGTPCRSVDTTCPRIP